jgi:Fe-S-cluster containining protein
MRWKDDPARAELLALYATADELVRDATCACSTPSERGPDGPEPSPEDLAPCCHFALTGREPYPTAVEVTEVLHAARARGARRRTPGRRLPIAPEATARRCPLLSDKGRCTIYASRPLGCRTFFCDRGDGPPRHARAGLLEIARRVADLSARFAPRDPLPRPLVRVLDREL